MAYIMQRPNKFWSASHHARHFNSGAKGLKGGLKLCTAAYSGVHC